MTDRKIAVTFPGQGSYDAVALRAAFSRYPQVANVFKEIDAVSIERFSRSITDLILGERMPTLGELLADEPWVSQLVIYGADVAAYRVLTDFGLRPDVLVGHSLGEIAALIAAGAFSITDGAHIVATRVQVIQEQNLIDGRMAALSIDSRRAQALADLIGDPLFAIATENHDEQVVISGPSRAIDRALTIASALQIGAAELSSPFPFHTPLLQPAMSVFASQIKDFDQGHLRIPVYSPVLGRYYEDDDSLADLLAEHFVRPVRFGTAVRHLYGKGVRDFVEAGGMASLSKIVERLLAGQEAATWPTISADRAGCLTLDATVAGLRSAGLITGSPHESLGALLAPGTSAEVFAEFWSAFGPEITEYARRKLTGFERPGVSPTSAAPAAATPLTARAATADVVPGPVVTVSEPRPSAGQGDRNSLATRIRAIYAAGLEYPEEVFSDDVLLEAELGVDSVKQVELLTRVSEEYGLSPNGGVRLTDYDTMGKIVDFILSRLHAAPDSGIAA
jgi:acyl transferase domain-containing protein/acyl carrier protein